MIFSASPAAARGGFDSDCPKGRTAVAGAVGYHQLLSNYPDYQSLGTIGGTLNFITPKKKKDGKIFAQDYGMCSDRWFWRINLDYLPMQVPAGNYNMREYGVRLGFSYMTKFMEQDSEAARRWIPFMGLGVGLIGERTSIDSPATGSLSGTQLNLEGMLSAGWWGPFWFQSTRFTPEMRLHAALVPGGFATSAELLVGLTSWTKDLENRRGRRNAK